MRVYSEMEVEEYKNLRVYGAWVWGNPVDEHGWPYINQHLPVRKATLWERFATKFGVNPK